MAKVWNITDHPGTTHKPHQRSVLGRSVMPGHYVRVDDERLKGAKKTQVDIKAGLLYVGEKPPADYTALKHPVLVRLPEGHTRSHGTSTAKPAAEKSEPVEMKEVVASSEEATEETSSEEETSFRGSRGSRRGRGSRS